MNPNRSTDIPSPLAISNIVCRGGTQDWQELYGLLLDDAKFRKTASMMLQTADTEGFPGCVALFQDAIEKMDCGTSLPGVSCLSIAKKLVVKSIV